MSTNYEKPFADWLSISFSASATPLLEMDSFLIQLGITERKDSLNMCLYKFLDGGTCYVTIKKQFHNFSFSGSTLSALRKLGLINEFVSLLMSYPSNITRLDIAFDVLLPFPTYYRKLKTLYPLGQVEVRGHTRKSQAILGNCPRTNLLTGTYYFQNKNYKGSVNLRVYDKSNEVYERIGEIIPSTTRLELTLKRYVSLKHFVSPESCFWHYLPSELLKVPENVPEFEPVGKIVLTDHVQSDLTSFQQFDSMFARSAYLQALKSMMVGKPLADKRAMRLSILQALQLHDISL